MANRAAWYNESKQYPMKLDDAPMPSPGPHQILVKNHAIAFNPVDAMVQLRGVLVDQFPSVLGEDLAGEVTAIGPEVTRFKVGDRVVGLAAEVMFGKPFSGSFQLYTLVNDDLVSTIPDHVSFTQASVLPLGLSTAADSIHNAKNLALPLPQLNPKPLGKVVVIWGASSSVGSCAVQLALAAGAEVATTSSAHNLQYCRDLGAHHVFDYKSPTIVEDIVEALKGKSSAGVMCAVIDDKSMITCAEIADCLDGRKFMASRRCTKCLRDGRRAWNWVGGPVGAGVWEHWLRSALDAGAMKCKPEPQIVGKGLEFVQEALDLMAKGVSAKKLVVEL